MISAASQTAAPVADIAARARFHAADIADVGQQAALQPWIEMDCVQLSRGQHLADFASLDLGTLQIVQERQFTAVQKLGVTPANLCTISFCTADPGFRFSDHPGAVGDEVFLMPEHTAFDLFVPSGVQTTYVSLDQAALMRDARALNPRRWDRAPLQLMAFNSHNRASLSGLLATYLGAVRHATARGHHWDDQRLARRVFHTVLQLMSASEEETGTPPSGWRALRICRAARTCVEDWQDEDHLPRVADLCAATGVSERSLYYAFRGYVGLSPVAYLRLCRLNKARAALRDGDPQATTVTEVAMHLGFEHLGRFAGDYKRHFGEAPSATLAASARKATPASFAVFG